jgi:transcriptional regulator with XRE-family HTH domain
MSLAKQVCTGLKKFRQEKNFCQEYIAEKLGISVAAYSNLESGKSKILLDRIEEIASILQIDSEFFFQKFSRTY